MVFVGFFKKILKKYMSKCSFVALVQYKTLKLDVVNLSV